MRIENLSVSKPESYISSEYPIGNAAITYAPGHNSRNNSRWMTSIGAVMIFIGLFGIMSALASPPARAEHYIRKNGAIVASIDGRYFKSNGLFTGEYDGTYIRSNGKILGQIDGRWIRANGSIIGEIDGNYLRSNGSIIYIIENNGYVRKDGRIYLQVDGYSEDLKLRLVIYLFFFDR
ncbi:MAG: hypothetical protein AB2L14_18020 [Candidatus Xenobiia bacterium LiM19]